jgi:peroxidase
MTMQFRTLDGSQNNLTHTDFNAAGTDFTRLAPANFADGISTMVDGPNPRTVSNLVVAGDGSTPENPEGFSGMMYAWGQFIDHDLDLALTGGANIGIAVPAGDPNFPAGSIIPVTRAVIDPATGAGTGHPATAVNAITGWLDGSMVYGSDATTAASLYLADGYMKTSAGGNLPIVDGMYAAGDVRAAENPSLTALQTLFLREHNYQVGVLHNEHPHWSADELYDHARAIATAEIAHITYAEFLPHLLGPSAIAPYDGYDPNVDPRITEEFAGAAYRFGHSIVSAETTKISENGAQLGPAQELKDVFFEQPAAFSADSGADGILRHLASDSTPPLDVHIVDDLRNFLSDPPDGQDLAAINIQRGRDLGLGTLNETRHALGLQEYTDFGQITSDPQTAAALETAYGTVDKIDLWTGGLAEDHAQGAFVGPTFQTIIAKQFTALRDGDRLWFENQGFDGKTLHQIEQTSLADIIQRDTDTGQIQSDVFVFTDRHSGTAGGIASTHPEAPQLVIGSDGTDTLIGGPKADTLVAGTGHQTLTGGDGNDLFVFDKHGINATITDFQPGQDRLEFEHLGRLTTGALDIHAEQDKTVIEVAGDEIVLNGLSPHQLGPHDFIFLG